MKVAIAGAGNVGRSIAAELVENGHDVVLIDKDPGAIRPKSLPGATWLHADACEIASLERADLAAFNVVVAATGDDKANLVLSLLAKTEYAVPRVVARVNHPKNEWLFNESWGVDVSVSSPRLLTALVEEAVSVGDLVRLMRFMQGQASLVEMTLGPDAIATGQIVAHLRLPNDAALVAILREGRVVLPTPDAPLEAGDELFFIATTAEVEVQLADMLGATPVRGSDAGI